MEDQLRNVTAFCKELYKDLEYYTPGFYLFFNIPDEFQTVDFDIQSEVSSVHRPSEIRLSILSGQQGIEDVRNSEGETIRWYNFRLEPSEKYCPYFHISLEKFA